MVTKYTSLAVLLDFLSKLGIIAAENSRLENVIRKSLESFVRPDELIMSYSTFNAYLKDIETKDKELK